MTPKDLNAFLTYVHAAETANFLGGLHLALCLAHTKSYKNSTKTIFVNEISTLPTKSQTFFPINIFLIAPRDLH